MEKRLIIKGHEKNPLVKFWNWGWGIYYKNPEVWNYLIVGGLTTLVSLAIKFGLYFTVLNVEDKFEAQLGVIISWIGAVLFAYITNRIFVFNSNEKNIIKEMASFIGSRLLTLLMEACLTYIFFSLLGLTSKIWIVGCTLIIQVLIMVLNYIFSKLFVFKK